MHDARRTESPARGGGIPDGLLVGLLAFLLGLAVLVWTATGLAAVFAKGAWPDTVTFHRTPEAVRALITEPHDIAAAWPDTDPAALSGWGLFWGLFVSQLLVMFVLTVFAIGVIARTKSRRALSRQAALDPVPQETPHPEPARPHVPAQPAATAAVAAAPTPEPAPAPDRKAPADEAYRYGHGYAPPATPAPSPTATAAPRSGIAYGGPNERFHAAAHAIGEAEGAALVVTSSPTLWAETKDARAKLGPVLLYDPSHLCDTPARMHWNPAEGCADRDTAAARAIALLAPVRPQARMDAAVADTAETLLRSWLQAVALDDRPFKQLHRWTQGNSAQDPVRILRTHPQAAPGAAA